MTVKTRMNQGHREVLDRFSEKRITKLIDRKPEQKIFDKMVKSTNTAIRKKYPEADMEILKKYQLTTHDNCIKYVFPSGRIDGFTFPSPENEYCDIREEYLAKGEHVLVEVPARRGCHSNDVFPIGEEFEKNLDDYRKLKDANDKIYKQKLTDYRALINSAKYIEDVLEVIKVPKELEKDLLAKSTALLALTPETIARIQADFNS